MYGPLQQNEDQLFQQPTNTYSNPPPNNHNSGGSYRYQESGSYRQQASQPDNYTYQPHSGGSGSYRQPSYRQQSYDANYPPEDGYPTSGHGYSTAEGQSNTDTYANHPFNQSSLHFSQSREGLLPVKIVKISVTDNYCSTVAVPKIISKGAFNISLVKSWSGNPITSVNQIPKQK